MMFEDCYAPLLQLFGFLGAFARESTECQGDLRELCVRVEAL